MPNPHPKQNELFKARRAQPVGSRALSRGQVSFRLLPEHYDLICSHPSKGVFARDLVTAMFEGRYEDAIALVEKLQEDFVDQKLDSAERKLDEIESDLGY